MRVSLAMTAAGRRTTTDRVGAEPADRLPFMEAVFISLMALVVLLTGYVALLVLYKLFKADH